MLVNIANREDPDQTTGFKLTALFNHALWSVHTQVDKGVL